MPVKEKTKDRSNLFEISESQLSTQTIIYFLQRLESRVEKLDTKLDNTKKEIDTKLDNTKKELENKIDKLDSKVASHFKWTIGILFSMMGIMIAGGITLITLIIK